MKSANAANVLPVNGRIEGQWQAHRSYRACRFELLCVSTAHVRDTIGIGRATSCIEICT